MRARDRGLACGSLPPGARNTIADVPGVGVGHTSLNEGDIHTGVTAIVPHPGDLFRDKLPAAAVVLNGFGKSIGLMQLNELGTLETPILLSNTFAIGSCANALIRRAIAANPEIGRRTATVNPVVLECNDGYLNDIQAMVVTEAHAQGAIEAAQADFAVGSVGAGTAMSCFGLKGGIGSASRRLRLNARDHHLGVLVLANFGNAGDLLLPGGQRISATGPRKPARASWSWPPTSRLSIASCAAWRRARARASLGAALFGEPAAGTLRSPSRRQTRCRTGRTANSDRSVCWPSLPSTFCSARRLRRQRRRCSMRSPRRRRSKAATAIDGSVFARFWVADASVGRILFGRGLASVPTCAFVETRQPVVPGGEAEVNQPQFRRLDLSRPSHQLRAALAVSVAVDHFALAVVRAVRPARERGRLQQVASW